MEIFNLNLNTSAFDDFNNTTKKSGLHFSRTAKHCSEIKFIGYENNTFKNNLAFVDADLAILLPVIAQLLHHQPSDNLKLCQRLVKLNVFNIELKTHAHLYSHKLKQLLKAGLNGLNAFETLPPDVCQNKDIRIAKTKNGEQLLFHSNELLEHLFKNTSLQVLETEVNDSTFKLNLQIRFLH